ncbi:MAG TPA: prolipoprotein diacylglyceryl transferase, partial [Bacilli bacterium]|nr:prolipoprotein diacylglyceryl transferase [Bacilli bacterium]
KNQFAIYLMSYGLFRFLIEFAREDDRGAFIGKLSPSQTLSLLAIIAGIVLLVLPHLMQKRKNNPQKAN